MHRRVHASTICFPFVVWLWFYRVKKLALTAKGSWLGKISRCLISVAVEH